jgi:hypothetical protein
LAVDTDIISAYCTYASCEAARQAMNFERWLVNSEQTRSDFCGIDMPLGIVPDTLNLDE